MASARGPFARSTSDRHNPDSLHGLVHDLGHELATLRYLVEAVRTEPGLGERSLRWLELLDQEIYELVQLVHSAVEHSTSRAVPLRAMLERVATLVSQSSTTSIIVTPGPDLVVFTDPTAVRRVVNNLVGNAVRAAGPHGRVVLAAGLDDRPERRPYLEIIDNGPGFGKGEPGWSSRGLGIVWQQAKICRAGVHVSARLPHGTCVRLTFDEPAHGFAASIASTDRIA